MPTEIKQAACRLRDYFGKLGSDDEGDYPEGFDPAEDIELVYKALEKE